MDDSKNASLMSWRSHKARRVTRSVLGAEVLAFVEAVDEAFILRHLINDLIGLTVPIEMYTDSQSIFATVMKANVPQEKRLVIDLASIRESYRNGIIKRIGFVSSKQNLADALTKDVKSERLQDYLATGVLSFDVNE
ncbi:hypothetical protein NDN08_002100 [Rhodosorus marinus]|nr:hypothetical protein NDN08_002100 [Rhodosorus marinus]